MISIITFVHGLRVLSGSVTIILVLGQVTILNIRTFTQINIKYEVTIMMLPNK